MASWVVHLRIGEQLLARFPLDAERFLIGSVAPDCGRQNPDGLTYTPSKAVSHFTPDATNASIDYSGFYNAYIRDARDAAARAFLFGYLAHLVTDKLWGETVFEPSYRQYGAAFPSKAAFIKAVKRDWYDLDSLYLFKHPNFRAYSILTHIERFTGDYLPFYPPEIIDAKLKSIAAFYENRQCNLSRTDYFYLTEAEADDFVARAVALCTNVLAPYMGA